MVPATRATMTMTATAAAVFFVPDARRLPSASASSTKAMPSSARLLTMGAPFGLGHRRLPPRQEHADDEADAERGEDRGQRAFPYLVLDLLQRRRPRLARLVGDVLGTLADLLGQVL